MVNLSENNILIFLVQVFILLGLARVIGEIFRRRRQPAIAAEILTGVILGPTILGRFFPHIFNSLFPSNPIQETMLATIASLGVLLLLLETGLEMDFSAAWRYRGEALKIALSGIIIPIIIGFILCLFLPRHYMVNPEKQVTFALFMATVMSISAMPIAARAMHDLNIFKTDLGFLIISAISVNDIIGWFVFTLVMGFFLQTQVQLADITWIMAVTLVFSTLCLTIGRKFSNYAISFIKEKRMPEPGSSLTFICLLGLFCGAISQKIGIYAFFGFFIAGVIAGESRNLSERTRQVISQMVFAVFVPLFFAGLCLKVDFLKHFDPGLVLFITTVSIGGKFIGAWIGAVISRLPKANRLAVAVAHTSGAGMDIVLGAIAIQYRLITEPVFVGIICAAIVSALLIGPGLSYSLKRRKEISVLEFFSGRGVIADFSGVQKESAISQACALACEQQKDIPDTSAVYAAVMERENKMGTGLEDGIAVPHARLQCLDKPVIIFGRSITGIEWDSPDGSPARFIFLILTPKGNDHAQIQILKSIAKVMSQEQARKDIMASKDSAAIWRVLHKLFSPHLVTRKKH